MASRRLRRCRDPDSGSRGYIDRVWRDKWTQADVERELRKSPEYRARWKTRFSSLFRVY